MAKAKNAIKSVEPQVKDLICEQLRGFKLDYKLEQTEFGDNHPIDKALNEYYSKSGGRGGNRPDLKMILKDSENKSYPIVIECKGYENALVKLNKNGMVDNVSSSDSNRGNPNYANIKEYAVNGAVHYANAIIHHTTFTDVIAIGVTGYMDESDELQIKIEAYFVSKENLGVGQLISSYSDISFLAPKNFNDFINKIHTLSMSDEDLKRLKEEKERQMDDSLRKLNEDVYRGSANISASDLVHIVSGSIIANLGIPNKLAPLHKEELKSSEIDGERDGDIIMRRISQFLREKQIPDDKRNIIIAKLNSILLSPTLNKPNNGISPLKNLFTNVVDDLGVYYKLNLGVDFTGKLFNEMYKWLGFTEDPKNDVVLTPPYVAKLLVKLAKVNKDSYVWDFCTGSAGLLIAAMEEMTRDARNTIYSPKEYEQKWLKIRAEQLIGLEILPSVYMLAVINMILMGDGSSNILEQDSLKFDGKYAYGKREGEKFPATAFVLNPPYSVAGGGMVFVEKALNMMEGGYAAIIIKRQAGEGGATEFNKRILERNTLLASIKMPDDLFIGKAIVSTRVYVFKVGEKHHKDQLVKFIDFSDDGYKRTTRKKTSKTLYDVGNAVERYQEIVDLVHFGKHKLNLIDESCYHEATIDPMNGADWNQVCENDNGLEDLDSKIYETISSLIAYHM